MKHRIAQLAKWSKAHASELVTLIGLLICVFVLFVLLSWGVGFYLNGIFGCKFDLGSVWQGIGACAAAVGSMLTLAGVNFSKQYIDSKYNSPAGEKPMKDGDINDKRGTR